MGSVNAAKRSDATGLNPKPRLKPMSCSLGFVPDGRKPGRPRNEVLAHLRSLFPEYSERTVARLHRGLDLLAWGEVPDEVQQRVLKRCTRPNGSLNVAEFKRSAEDVAVAHLLDAAFRDLVR